MTAVIVVVGVAVVWLAVVSPAVFCVAGGRVRGGPDAQSQTVFGDVAGTIQALQIEL